LRVSRIRRASYPFRFRVALVAAALVTAFAAPAVASTTQPTSLPPQARLQSKQAVPTFFNQGIAHIQGGWILSGTDSPLPNTDVLVRTDERLNVMVRNGPAIPPEWRAQGYDHIGDIDVVGDVVYAPFEEPDYSLGHQATARYDARTLRFRDAVVLPQHENSFVAVDRTTHIAYSMDHFDGHALLRYDIADGWRSLAPLRLSMLLHKTQGAGVAEGAVWISTSDERNGVYRVDPKTGHAERVAQLLDPPGEGEGIDVTLLRSGRLHAMVIDPDKTKVWVEHLTLPATPGNAHSSGDSGNAWIWIASVGAVVLLIALLGLWQFRRRTAQRA
jgi:hypothetical protein